MRYEVEIKALINAYFTVEADSKQDAIRAADDLFQKESNHIGNLAVRDYDSSILWEEGDDDDMHQDAVYGRRYLSNSR